MIKLGSGSLIVAAFGFLLLTVTPIKAQNAGSIDGVVKDQTGGAVAGAKVGINFPVTGFQRETTTAADGSFRFTNIPFNPYHLTVAAQGLAPYTRDVDVRSTVPVTLDIALVVGAAQTTTVEVTAKGEDLVEKEPTFHTDIDQAITDRMPIESATSSISSLVTLMAPGIAADSNGLFHGLGDHAQNSFSVDNQPITDQQSKIFSNQIPSDSVQSMEVISGAPPA
jgi:carboxypeptidase family protein